MRAFEQSLCGNDWELSTADARRWPASVPGCAHSDLMRAKMIPHPDAPGGEQAQEWIGRTEFTWSREFAPCAEVMANERIELVFERIDTVAVVKLDGQIIASVANEFHPHRIDITALMRASGQARSHRLEVICAAPVTTVENLEAKLGKRPVNGDWTPYPFMRKTACEFGWDWGPRVASSGIRSLVYLHGWSAGRIDAVRPLVMQCDEQSARVAVHVDVAMLEGSACRVRVAIESPSGEVLEGEADVVRVDAKSKKSEAHHALVELEFQRPARWWPRGHGAQNLYRVRVELASGRTTLARWSGRIGLRSVELDTSVDRDNSSGSHFRLKINGQMIWCAGANWIPDGVFREEDRARCMRERLTQACEANLVMLRVWGGGGYETDDWYGHCDELGILVWQDFAFACASYPEDDPFPSLVASEARWQLARLSVHPSLVIWCGGNEDILAWYSWGFRDRLAPEQSWGHHYWLELLPEICAQVDPSRPYWVESPWSGSLDIHPNDPDRGDRHTWDAHAKVEELRSITPRFCSEFGHQSPPALISLANVLALPETQLASMSPREGCVLIADRQRATGGDEPQYGEFLSSRFSAPDTFELWIAQAQAVQARAMRIAYSWMRARRPRCSGALVWQLNDAWTGHSWSLIDVQSRPKPAWHAVRDACASRILAIHRVDGELRVEAVNDTAMPWRSSVTISQLSLSDRIEPIRQERCHPSFEVAPWGAACVAIVPAAMAPSAHAVLKAAASTGLSAMPTACAWDALAHDREWKDEDGVAFVPRGTLTWLRAPAATTIGAVRAAIEVHAITPLIDAVMIPRGEWTAVEPMYFSLAAGERRVVEVSWRAALEGRDPGAILVCAGVRVAEV